ncbi:RlpA-like double-psi beta-barrel-protein domain-containing protein-containing protein [Daldinia vernicosa]|uniref:RlpA-like double-psi beta-barrel-protein domain-containing protein-containing protein n=1 Tax=Daldinia vernicosa TaxID=114800 RepID=UPI002008B474|nr:RlpA-like double-psi beta-barrel-protein domain-containing protein-containing protein [Daldinia vernicosa]KAI0848032.1 RlpA-like double-psi beta-barrel-protein domain-containing protein-containing protein [Daldinia vernicosa]
MYTVAKAVIALGAFIAPSVAFSGDMTYYAPGLGACGNVNTESDAVVAVSSSQDGNCGRTINISYNGKTASATIVDECPGCPVGSIDVSPVVFEQLESLDAGRVQVTWEYA